MPVTILPCGCPCTNLENPCDCCPCITNVKIYSNISLNITGSGSSPAYPSLGDGQRNVSYTFSYTNSIDSLLDIPNGSDSSLLACASCRASDFSANASLRTGFLSTDFDFIQNWVLAPGTNCPTGSIGCQGSATGGRVGDCPLDVCLDGQVLHLSPAGSGETDLQVSNCYYKTPPDGDFDDHLTEYFCNSDLTSIVQTQDFFGDFTICPSTNFFSLSLSLRDVDYMLGFSLSTSPVNGTLIGYVVLNNSQTQTPLYLGYPGPGGMTSKSITGEAIIGIEFDYAIRNPTTNLCPTV